MSQITGLSLDPMYVDAIQTLARNLATTRSQEEQVRFALDTAIGATGSTGGSVLLHDPERHDLRFVYSVNKRDDALPPEVQDLVAATIADDEGVAGRVFQTGRAAVVNDPRNDPDFARHVVERTRIKIDSIATVPITIHGMRALGVMQLINKEGGYGEEDLKVLSVLATVVALSILLSASRG